jgi:hypothetical protein
VKKDAFYDMVKWIFINFGTEIHHFILADMKQIITHFTDDDLYKLSMCCAVIDN